MPQFLDRFPRVSETASGAGFWKGLLTAMIELGALLGEMQQECFTILILMFIGALNQGWIADKVGINGVILFCTGR